MQNECSPEIEREARAWVADCDWADLDADAVDDLPLAAVIRGIDRHYVGGFAAFVESQDTAPEHDEIAWLENRQDELRAIVAAGSFAEGCAWLFTDELEENRRVIAWLRDDSPTAPSIFRPYGVGWARYATKAVR